MPQLIRPNQVKIMTNDGEVNVHITLDLNVNLEGGVVNMSKKQEEEEEAEILVPTFSPSKKIKFGKKDGD